MNHTVHSSSLSDWAIAFSALLVGIAAAAVILIVAEKVDKWRNRFRC